MLNTNNWQIKITTEYGFQGMISVEEIDEKIVRVKLAVCSKSEKDHIPYEIVWDTGLSDYIYGNYCLLHDKVECDNGDCKSDDELLEAVDRRYNKALDGLGEDCITIECKQSKLCESLGLLLEKLLQCDGYSRDEEIMKNIIF